MSEIAKVDIVELEEVESPSWNLDLIVSELRLSREVTHNIRHGGRIHRTPSRLSLETILGNIVAALFPTHFGGPKLAVDNIDYFVGNTLNNALVDLVEQVRRGLFFAQDEVIEEQQLRHTAAAIVRDFAQELPSIGICSSATCGRPITAIRQPPISRRFCWDIRARPQFSIIGSPIFCTNSERGSLRDSSRA